MARDGVTYEQVIGAAEGLVAEGKQPTIRGVRERLRDSGSPNTIHRHLNKWRDTRMQGAARASELPASIAKEIHQEIARAVAEVRAETGDRLVQVQAEASELAAVGEALEVERDDLFEQVRMLTSERDVLAGKAAEQAEEMVRLGKDVERERRVAEEARMAAMQARLSIEGQEKILSELRVEIERVRVDLLQEREARIEAQRNHASLDAHSSSLADRVLELQGRERMLAEQVASLHDELANTRREVQARAIEAATLAGQVMALGGDAELQPPPATKSSRSRGT